MKGLADEPTYIIELLEEGVTLDNVIDGHIYEQALVSGTRLLVFPTNRHVCLLITVSPYN